MMLVARPMDGLGTPRLIISTTLATSLLVACAGVDSTASAASPASADGSSTGTDGSSTGPDGDADGCPAEAPVLGYVTCTLPANRQCHYVQACNSGEVGFDFTCSRGYFEVVPERCAMPYDSCVGTQLNCSDVWQLLLFPAPDGPAQCPSERPVDGSPCTFYSSRFCGYTCNPEAATGWTVVECSGESWQSDGACAGTP